MTAERVERDLLGERELPADALFGIGTLRAVEAASFSGIRLADRPRLASALAVVKVACARANLAAGLLPGEIADAIVRAAEALAAGQHAADLVVDVYAGGGGIALNANVNEVVANLASERLGGRRGAGGPVEAKRHVNLSQSTADVCRTAFQLALRDAGHELDGALGRLAEAYARQGDRLRDVTIIGRTCLQPALTLSLGASLAAAASMLVRRRASIARAYEAFDVVSLGGTVIGTGAGATPEYRAAVVPALAARVGRPLRGTADAVDAAQHVDPFAEAAATLGVLAGALVKLAQDLRRMGADPSAGHGELRLPAVQEGSSFFPGKINPTVPETVLAACALTLGAVRTVETAHALGEDALNVFEATAAITTLDATERLAAAVTLLAERCVEGLEAGTRSEAYEATLARL